MINYSWITAQPISPHPAPLLDAPTHHSICGLKQAKLHEPHPAIKFPISSEGCSRLPPLPQRRCASIIGFCYAHTLSLLFTAAARFASSQLREQLSASVSHQIPPSRSDFTNRAALFLNTEKRSYLPANGPQKRGVTWDPTFWVDELINVEL